MTLTSKNVSDTIWLKKNFPESFASQVPIHNSVINIRLSRKQVMRGFMQASGPSKGAFALLLKVFSGFENPHNPNSRQEQMFFNGDSGNVQFIDSSEDFFLPNEYNAVQNNLHTQFRNIANDIRTDSLRNHFYVIYSDGETTIRQAKNQNTTELNQLKSATKDMLKSNPHLQIGVLAISADFNGVYVYDPGQSAPLTCTRYLYALCFFDKKFLPEFDRAAHLNKNNGGINFLFNPQLTHEHFKVSYLTEKIDGQANQAKDNRYAAFPMSMKGKDLDFKFRNDFSLHNITLPSQVQIKATKFTQSDSIKFGNSNTFLNSNVNPNNEVDLKITKLDASCIVKTDFWIDYNRPLDSLASADFLNLNIDDNTLEEVNKVKALKGLLKTEGLRDMFQEIFDALEESKKTPFLSNFIQLGKFK